MIQPHQIRNFAIIAHVDHGKSTLADRLLERTGTLQQATAQTLDANPIEKERGITIKLAPVRMEYAFKGEKYVLNLVDTPGHVDFSYEVSRALAACEGALLVVDATQGIQAQTLAHFGQAKKLGLKLIPVINKIDLPTADVESTTLQLLDLLNVEESEILHVSAKTGLGMEALLEAIIERIPAPQGNAEKPLRALVFNSDFLSHQGVRAWVRIIDGTLDAGSGVHLYGTKLGFVAQEIGIFKLQSVQVSQLSVGEVGYVITGSKNPQDVVPGDTLMPQNPALRNQLEPLPGYKPPQPMVFLSIYPIDSVDFKNLSMALDKLHLLDSSLTYSPESSALLGQGFRVGFLGLLHAEIVQERLEREFDLSVIATTPTVTFQVKQQGEIEEINNASDIPEASEVEEIREPILAATIFVPHVYLGGVFELMKEKRAELKEMHQVGNQVQLIYDLPLMEMVGDFYSRLKSVSSGFASLDYEFKEWKPGNLVRMDCLLAGDKIGVLSQVVPKEKSFTVGQKLVTKLAEIIPRHQFEIAVQATIGMKIIARSTIKPFRKDVTAKLYGGDQTRKDKLLNKQKKGKKKMKQLGRVTIPPDMFWKLLS